MQPCLRTTEICDFIKKGILYAICSRSSRCTIRNLVFRDVLQERSFTRGKRSC